MEIIAKILFLRIEFELFYTLVFVSCFFIRFKLLCLKSVFGYARFVNVTTTKFATYAI